MYSNSDPRRHTWLYRSLCLSAFKVAEPGRADLTSTVCKQLKLVQPALVEGSWKMCNVGQWMLPRIQEGWLRNPYTQVRQAVAQVLFLINRNAGAGDVILTDFICFVGSALGSFNYLKSDATEAKTNTEEQSFIETGLHWVYACLSWDTAPIQNTLLTLLPHVLKAQHHTDPQCNALAKYAASNLAWVRGLNEDGVAKVLLSVAELSQIPNWELKASCFKFLQVFIPRYSFLFKDAQVKALFEACEIGLVEARVEVRQSACAALASLASSCVVTDKRRDLFIKRSFTRSVTKLPKPITSETLSKRHGGVLGLSVYVTIHPYDVPTFLPSIVAKLASHIADPPPIDKTVKTLLVDFKSTHKDEWDRFKTQFTLEELEAVEQAEIAPSYFA
jgi:proteasome activator subunit 4